MYAAVKIEEVLPTRPPESFLNMIAGNQVKKQVCAGAEVPAHTCFLKFSPPPFTGEGSGVGVKDDGEFAESF